MNNIKEKEMVGKTLYKAKIRDKKLVMECRTIVRVGRKKYNFTEKGPQGCLKTDVGVVCFLTPKEALAYLEKNIRESIENGKNYLTMLNNQLNDVLNWSEK
jgi:hypothetical protein